MQNQPHPIQGEGLAAGRLMGLGSRRVNPYSDAKGSLELEVLNQGFALLLDNIMGSNATLVQKGTTTAYSLTTTLGVPDNQNYLSMQVVTPDTGGNLKQQNYHGCKITSAEFTMDVTKDLTVTLDVDSQQWENTNSLDSPTYSSNSRNFTFNGMTFGVGTYGSETFIDGVTKLTCKIERSLYTNRIYMGQSVKAEPITNNYVKVTGTADVDLTPNNKSVLWDIFNTQTAIPSIRMVFTGNAIGSSGFNDQVVLNPTDVFVDSGGTPELDGPDVVKTTINWTGQIDANNDSAFLASLVTGDSTF